MNKFWQVRGHQQNIETVETRITCELSDREKGPQSVIYHLLAQV